MASQSNILTVVTYNCHGFNQGKTFLNSICNTADNVSAPDCIFLQELWLTPENMHKIENFSEHYMFYGISAMEHKVSSSVLIRRPSGGVGVLIKHKYIKFLKFIETSERFVSFVINSNIFVNVYLPNIKVETDREVFSDTLTSIEGVLAKFKNCNVIWGGDLNLSLVKNNDWSSKMFFQFMQQYDLLLCDHFLSNVNSIQYSFSNEVAGRYSLIDYFVVSRRLFDNVQDCIIIESPINMSDHNPVVIKISDCIDTCMAASTVKCNDECEVNRSYNVLRWDHSDLSLYYNITFQLFSPLMYDMKTFLSSNYDATDLSFVKIDQYYESIIGCLNNAASQSILSKKVNFFKFWWDTECDVLKENSIHTHRLWVDLGRPKSGDAYLAKARAKLVYKSYIANKAKLERNQISDSLHEALLCKENTRFWNIWNSKFGDSKSSCKIISGESDSQIVADNFANFFSNIYDNKESCQNEFNAVFERKFSEYLGSSSDLTFDIATVDSIIRNLKKGKAAGIDNISCEHLQNAHPIVFSCITMLFNLMIELKYVPSAFGVGIIVPIPKGNKSRNHNKIEDYRGITVSCIISKIFESCLLLHIKKYLFTSDRQFGFKQKVGCSDAIYSLRKTVDYFTTKGSTVNICSLDLSKAFDKVNFKMLFFKLMDRNVPKRVIEILSNWYSKLFSYVRWNDKFSTGFFISSGVRQGGLLSPILFAICVDDLLVKLEKSKLGCFVKLLCCNSFMYADDLVLLSITIQDLQSLVNISLKEINNVGLDVNSNKTFCIRIGSRHSVTCSKIVVNSKSIEWVNEICYLGITICSAKHFKVNFQNRKQKFFRALNAIFSKLGTSTSPAVIISLVESYCVPILLYASECIEFSNSVLRSLENAYSQMYSKLFHSFDKTIIKQCQFYSGQMPIELKIANKKLKFLQNLSLNDNTYCKYFDFRNGEFISLIDKYCCANDGSNVIIATDNIKQLGNIYWKRLLKNYFELSLQMLI